MSAPLKRTQVPVVDTDGFEFALLAGLSASPKRIPSKFFYDRTGSELFEQICALHEYYPTRTETELLIRHGREIAHYFGERAALVEFGAGALRKARILLRAMERPAAYLPIDISGDFLRGVARDIAPAVAGLSIRPIVADFTQPLVLPADTMRLRRVGYFSGSTIGNFEREDALSFLRMAARLLAGGGLLVGVDLVKDPNILHEAYNDAAGVTAAFNRNVLVRANRELGADFEVDRFAHYAFYAPHVQQIEMHLFSLGAQVAHVSDQRVRFAEGESILTEISRKFTVEGFQALASEAGLVPGAVWCDERRLFSLHWLEAPERASTEF